MEPGGPPGPLPPQVARAMKIREMQAKGFVPSKMPKGKAGGILLPDGQPAPPSKDEISKHVQRLAAMVVTQLWDMPNFEEELNMVHERLNLEGGKARKRLSGNQLDTLALLKCAAECQQRVMKLVPTLNNYKQAQAKKAEEEAEAARSQGLKLPDGSGRTDASSADSRPAS